MRSWVGRDRGCVELVTLRPGAEFLEIMIDTARRAQARGNLMFDAQIAALCLEYGIDTVLTNDRDFDRFEPLRVVRLE